MRRNFAEWMAGAMLLSPGFLAAQDDGDLFSKLDTNKDGVVSADEVPEQQKALFERLLRNADKDSDKKLNKDEFQAGLKPDEGAKAPLGGGGLPGRPGGGFPFGGIGSAQLEAQFDRMDANKDGKLTKDELPEGGREFLGRMLERVGGDGITKEQFTRSMNMMGQAVGRPGQPPGAPGMPPGPEGMLRPIMALIDGNLDGELSKEEIEGAGKALLTLDKNADGKLSRDELLAAGPPAPPGALGRPADPPGGKGRPGGDRPGGFSPEAFREQLKQADANGDGKLSKEEAPARLKDNFDRIDRNSDGVLDDTEIRQMLQRMQDGGGKGPKGGRPKGPPDGK
jgi:Ca2+-binding EF-hand superfamily protein